MRDATQTRLEFTFTTLRNLRISYSGIRDRDLSRCDEYLRQLVALLENDALAAFLNRQLSAKGLPSILYEKDRRRVLGLEKRLLDLVGGRRDEGKVNEALKKFMKEGSIDWVNSAQDCIRHLEGARRILGDELESASLLQFNRHRRNKKRIERADTAALAVGVLLVDLTEVADFPNSYGIGGYIAQ